MKLTPLDIKKQEFKKTLRGYDPVEVDAFLEMVADVVESMIREKKDLSDDLLKLKIQLKDYQSVEKTLQETLVNAQQNVAQSRENSNREAEMIIREAELKAEKIQEDVKLKLAEMKNELIVVKAQKDSFARRLRHLLESQIELMEVLELDDLGFKKVERPRPVMTSSKKPAQENIEFEGVEDIYPDEPITQVPATEEADEDRPAQEQWGNLNRADKEEHPPEQDTERPSRISDQLIT